jgi:branched-chain amino acid transport system substrate-binding protein
MKPALSTIALLIMATGMMSGCAPQKPQPSAPAKTLAKAPPVVSEQVETPPRLGDISPQTPSIKVGILLPLSGESQAVGTAMLDAAQLALYDTYLTTPSERIRAQVVLIPKDTGNTPAESAKMAQKVIDQGAKFIVGPLFSQSVSVVSPITKAANTSLLTFSNNQAVAAPGVYTFGFLPEQQVRRVAEYAYLNKYHRVALLAPNDAYGEKVRDSLSDMYIKKGGVVAPTELFAPSPANIEAAVTRLAGAYNNTPEDRRFQAIYIGDSGAHLKTIMRALKKSNLDLKNIKIIGTGLWDDPELTTIPELQGAWVSGPSPELYQTFERRFVNAYGYKPTRLSALAYDAVSFVAQVAMIGDGTTISDAALTDPRGFAGPTSGLVRLSIKGLSDRKLNVMEVVPGGFRTIEAAPKVYNDE